MWCLWRFFKLWEQGLKWSWCQVYKDLSRWYFSSIGIAGVKKGVLYAWVIVSHCMAEILDLANALWPLFRICKLWEQSLRRDWCRTLSTQDIGRVTSALALRRKFCMYQNIPIFLKNDNILSRPVHTCENAWLNIEPMKTWKGKENIYSELTKNLSKYNARVILFHYLITWLCN